MLPSGPLSNRCRGPLKTSTTLTPPGDPGVGSHSSGRPSVENCGVPMKVTERRNLLLLSPSSSQKKRSRLYQVRRKDGQWVPVSSPTTKVYNKLIMNYVSSSFSFFSHQPPVKSNNQR